MPTSLAALMSGPIGSLLGQRAVPPRPREVTQVTLLDGVDVAAALRPGAIAVVSRGAAVAGGYQLDILVRQAVEREVAALVVRRGDRRSLTAESLALRGRVAILDVADDADPGQVLDAVAAAVSGDSRTALGRLALAADLAPGPDDAPELIVQRLAELSGVGLALVPVTTGPGDRPDQMGGEPPAAPVDVDGRVRAEVRADAAGDAARVAVRLAADLVSRALTMRDRDTMRPARSRSSAVTQLLLCSPANVAAAAERAFDAGLNVDGWHGAMRLEVSAASPDPAALPAGADHLEDDVVAAVAGIAHDSRTTWTVAHPDSTYVLVATSRTHPGRDAREVPRRALSDVVAGLRERYPELQVRAGIAAAHQGPAGLRASAEEARTALTAARLHRGSLSVATYDDLGLSRMLAEWLTTESARDSVGDLLEPLDALGPDKAAVAIDTLHAYLDEHGSLQRAAARLNVHRNAVAYRIGQIKDVLPQDLSSPDARFALQLACRARLLTSGRPGSA